MRRFAVRLALWIVVLAAVWAPLSQLYLYALKAIAVPLATALDLAMSAGPSGVHPWLFPAFAVFAAAAAPRKARLAASLALVAAALLGDVALLLIGGVTHLGADSVAAGYASLHAVLLFGSLAAFAGRYPVIE